MTRKLASRCSDALSGTRSVYALTRIPKFKRIPLRGARASDLARHHDESVESEGGQFRSPPDRIHRRIGHTTVPATSVNRKSNGTTGPSTYVERNNGTTGPSTYVVRCAHSFSLRACQKIARGKPRATTRISPKREPTLQGLQTKRHSTCPVSSNIALRVNAIDNLVQNCPLPTAICPPPSKQTPVAKT